MDATLGVLRGHAHIAGMSRLLLSLVLIFALGASTSCSTDPVPRSGQVANLDALFQRLQTTRNAEEARMLEVTIRHVWAQSGRADVDTLMSHAVEQVHGGDYDNALKTLDRIVREAPAYAEGWNLRATVHYLRDDYGPALADIEQVLALEPRHFGALAGLGRIFQELQDKDLALRAFEAALALNPHLADVREETRTLREELAGIPI